MPRLPTATAILAFGLSLGMARSSSDSTMEAMLSFGPGGKSWRTVTILGKSISAIAGLRNFRARPQHDSRGVKSFRADAPSETQASLGTWPSQSAKEAAARSQAGHDDLNDRDVEWRLGHVDAENVRIARFHEALQHA